MKFKINGTRTSAQIFEDLVNEQILLLPFTVDHLGGIGTLAYHLLFGPDENKAPTPTTSNSSLRPTATASFYTTWPMANMPPLTFSTKLMKLDQSHPIHAFWCLIPH
jgi:hypothetical protein